jgi:hypothetical protein
MLGHPASEPGRKRRDDHAAGHQAEHSDPWDVVLELFGTRQETDRCSDRNDEFSRVDAPHHFSRGVVGDGHQRRGDHRPPAAATRCVNEPTNGTDWHQPTRCVTGGGGRDEPVVEPEPEEDHQAKEQ